MYVVKLFVNSLCTLRECIGANFNSLKIVFHELQIGGVLRNTFGAKSSIALQKFGHYDIFYECNVVKSGTLMAPFATTPSLIIQTTIFNTYIAVRIMLL